MAHRFFDTLLTPFFPDRSLAQFRMSLRMPGQSKRPVSNFSGAKGILAWETGWWSKMSGRNATCTHYRDLSLET